VDEHLDIGSSPPMESCVQVGSEGYSKQARFECRLYIELLRRTVGPEPEGARLSIASNPHDFGTYLSVRCYYDPTHPLALEYALRCEAEGPEEWDDLAREELSRDQERRLS
jgi:hypothetical protein